MMNVRWKIVGATLAVALATACQQNDDPEFSYYEERIGPVLQNGCARGPAGNGCHLARPDGTALGNLDVSSYDSLMRRADLLTPFGPYSTGLLLLKAGDQVDVSVETFNTDPAARFVSVTTDVRHNNGATIGLGSSAYAQLKQWIEAGHARTGVQDETLTVASGEVARGPGTHPLYDTTFGSGHDVLLADFRDNVQPRLQARCAGSSCHSSSIADYYIGGGDSPEETHWNFWISLQHMTVPASTSSLLRQPLSTYRGGVFHEGGNVFGSADDPDYVIMREFTERVEAEAPELLDPPSGITEGLRFFANRVQPVLVRKGCMFLNCHSVSMFHDLRLQGGAQGHFSRVGTYRNWHTSRLLLALDASSPNESRIIAKNLYPPEQVAGMPGLFHRGGPLLEDFGMGAGSAPNGATPDDCAGYDADNDDLNTIPGYCVLVRWWQIEREEAITSGEIFPDTEIVRSVVWVSRPRGMVGSPLDFDTYRPGADLLMAPATVAAPDGDISLGAESSLLAGCGLSVASADVRGPAVSWDGSRIAFGARTAAGSPMRLYWMASDGTGCELVPGVRVRSTGAALADTENGILTHDFDPAFSADGHLVFASSRGNDDAEILGFAGPSRTPAAMQPNSNLFVLQPDGAVRQLTFLLNQEIMPSFMTDGRVIMTAEKREPDFHQLAGRRQNLDGGDYHPLYAQRGSVGYASATEFVEQFDRNFAFVAGPLDAAEGAGRIAIANRSIGPDQNDRDPTDRFYISSQRFPVAGGVYRSPYPLPTGRLLAACDRSADDPTTGNYDYAICEINVDTGAVREIGGRPGNADIEPVAVYARAPREIFVSQVAEANAHTEVIEGQTDAQVNVVDFPLIATLLFANIRTGRPINYDIGGVDVYGEYPPPQGAVTFDDLTSDSSGGVIVPDDFGMMYLRRERLGHLGLNPDGSGRFRYRGGLPIVLGATGWDDTPLTFPEGAPFTGNVIQREQMQFYPGERSNQSFRRELFNGMCGGCHGSLSGRELDVVVDYDVLTSASQVQSRDQGPSDVGPGL